MIENMRGRSTETKYGRIPLWLYETGVGLQAIATYGWLHGRYGHYERVMPSYATLAKELGVSRGSVIAYVKSLAAVGAVRIETSGAAGRQTNLYVIAFNEPFEVAGQNTDQGGGGQNADRSAQRTSPSQPADWGGQPVVQEEDVSTKTFFEEDDLSLPSVPTQRTEPAPATNERETFTPPNNKPTTTPAADAADRIITAYTTILGRPLLTRTRTTLHQQATEALTTGYPEAWLTDRARELATHGWTDLAKHVEKSTAPLPGAEPTAAATSSRPPWCGECGSGYGTAAQFNVRFRRRDDGTLCHCHPDAARQPLPGTDTTVSGWLALTDQPRPSTTDARVQAALDLGRRMQAEHDAARGYQPYRQPSPEDYAADLGHF